MGKLAQYWASLPRTGWTLERFGLTPAKLGKRLRNPGAPKALCVSIPKAGTHLLERALCLHPDLYRALIPTVSHADIGRRKGLDGLLAGLRPGQVAVAHLRFQPEYPAVIQNRGARGFFLIRDPHDIVVSQVHYVSKRADHRLHQVLGGLPDMKEKLKLAIAGSPQAEISSIRERLDLYAGWLDSGCLVVRFEDLIGPGGGGDSDTQTAAVAAIYRHLGIDLDEAGLAGICDRLFSPESPTFRWGAIGGWQAAFDAELETLFDRVVGDAAAPYGYRKP